MMKALKYKGGIIPYFHGKYILRRVMRPETLCTFESKTGYIDFSSFDDRTVVTFEREKDNPVDSDAVKVLADGSFIGYFYRSSSLRPYLLASSKKDGLRYLARFAEINPVTGRHTFTVAFYVRFDGDEYEKIGTWPLIRDKKRGKGKLNGRLFKVFDWPWQRSDEIVEAHEVMYHDLLDDLEGYPPLPCVIAHVDSEEEIGHLPLESCISFVDEYSYGKLIAQVEKGEGKGDYLVSVYRLNRSGHGLHTLD